MCDACDCMCTKSGTVDLGPHRLGGKLNVPVLRRCCFSEGVQVTADFKVGTLRGLPRHSQAPGSAPLGWDWGTWPNVPGHWAQALQHQEAGAQKETHFGQISALA